MPSAPAKWIVTANFTADGSVAYFRANQTYSRQLSDAAVFDTKAAAEAAVKIALDVEREVSDPYLTEVGVATEGLDALTARERIRSQGPSVRVRRPDPLTYPAAEQSSRPSTSPAAEQSSRPSTSPAAEQSSRPLQSSR